MQQAIRSGWMWLPAWSGKAVLRVRTNWAEMISPLLVFVLFAPVSDLVRSDGLLSVNQVVLGVCVAIIVWLRRTRIVTDRVMWLMLLYAAIMLASGPITADRKVPAQSAAVFLREVVVVFVLANLVRTWRGLRVASLAAIVAGVVVAAVALLGWYTGQSLGGVALLYRGYIASGVSGVRMAGFIGDPNVFAQILLLPVPLALNEAVDARRRSIRWPWFAAAAVLVMSICLTFSRGAFVALVIVLAVMIARRTFPRRHLVVLALMLVAIVALSPPRYWDRVSATGLFLGGDTATEDESLLDRSRLWRVGALMFLDYPLTGVGMGEYGARYVDYYTRVDPDLPCCPMGAHNVVVRIAAETGIVGVASFGSICALAAVGLYQTKRRLRAAARMADARLVEALETGLLGYVLTSLLLDGQSMRTFWLVLGLAVAARQIALRPDGASPPQSGDVLDAG